MTHLKDEKAWLISEPGAHTPHIPSFFAIELEYVANEFVDADCPCDACDGRALKGTTLYRMIDDGRGPGCERFALCPTCMHLSATTRARPPAAQAAEPEPELGEEDAPEEAPQTGEPDQPQPRKVSADDLRLAPNPAPGIRLRTDPGGSYSECTDCHGHVAPGSPLYCDIDDEAPVIRLYALCDSCWTRTRERTYDEYSTDVWTDAEPPKCRKCGCTDDDCGQCIDKTGAPCTWVETNLCSACAGPTAAQPNAPKLSRNQIAHCLGLLGCTVPADDEMAKDLLLIELRKMMERGMKNVTKAARDIERLAKREPPPTDPNRPDTLKPGDCFSMDPDGRVRLLEPLSAQEAYDKKVEAMLARMRADIAAKRRRLLWAWRAFYVSAISIGVATIWYLQARS